MPNNITDVDIFTAPIQTVADGDAGSGANFALAPQGLANRTLNLKNRIDAIQAWTGWLQYAGDTSYLGNGEIPGWRPESSAGALDAHSYWRNHTNPPSASALRFSLPPFQRGTITELKTYPISDFNADTAGPRSALPTGMPSLSLFSVNPATFASTQVASITDTSANVAAFNANHSLTLTGSWAIDPALLYYAIVFGENSTNSLSQVLCCSGVRATVTV